MRNIPSALQKQFEACLRNQMVTNYPHDPLDHNER